MKLSERLRQQEAHPHHPPAPTTPAAASHEALPLATTAPTITVPPPAALHDPVRELKQHVRDALFTRLGIRLYDESLDEASLRELVTTELGVVLQAEATQLSEAEQTRVIAEISDDVLGYGPLEQFLGDADVSEVMVNGTASIYVERRGRLHRTDARFETDAQLRQVIDRIVARVGRRVDESSPMVDARLPDGSRVNAIVHPLAVDGPSLTIRKFSKERWGAEDLVRFGTLSSEMATMLSRCVEGRLNILVTGGTGTGKTTMLNVLSSFIPADERIVTIEDAVELQLQQDHVVRLESRPPNIEGRGQVEIRDLLRNALRMRPDRIIVGEVRGGEGLDMLQAMNTGHDGSISTVHANSPRDAISRMETMVLMAGMDLPAKAIREQLASALDLIVHISRLRDGTRRVTHVTEVVGMEGQVVTLQDVFLFDFAAGVDEAGRFRGHARPTGIRPLFVDRLVDEGVHIPTEVFVNDAFGGAR